MLQRPPSSRTSGIALSPNLEYENENLVTQIVNCIECVKTVPVLTSDQLEPGDHVIFCGAVYDHHGILISKIKSNDMTTLEIAEATNTSSRVVVGISKICGCKANVQINRKSFNFATQKICVVEYRHRLSKSETVQNAQRFIDRNEENRDYRYNLFNNNCEHFATYCATGRNISVQATKFRLGWQLFWESGFIGLSDELARNNTEFDINLICRDCYLMNRNLLGVSLKPIQSENDIKIGDIIRFSYWNLWHEAVVLQKQQTTRRGVVCSIAHYAFCGPFSHRTIKTESKEIRFDGQSKTLDYDAPQYNVYPPEEVVQRANSRMGEQLFAFFSNDSSHFARWCKLKLLRYGSFIYNVLRENEIVRVDDILKEHNFKAT